MPTTKFAIRYSTWNGRLLGVLGLGPRHSSVVVTDDNIEVAMGWGFSSVIPRSSIASVAPDDDRVWGWGVHGWRGQWLVNGTSQGLVRISIDPPARARVIFVKLDLSTLRVSVDDRDAFVEALA